MRLSKHLILHVIGLLLLTNFLSGCFLQTSVQDLAAKIINPINDETPVNRGIEISLNNPPVNGTTNLTHSVQVVSSTAISYIYKYGDSSTIDCQDLSGYSSTVSMADPILMTPPSLSGNFALCVLGINSLGERQDTSKVVKHIWRQSWAPFIYIEKPGQGLISSSSANLKIHAPSEWVQVYITDDSSCSTGGIWESIASQVAVTLAPDTTTRMAAKYAKFRTASGGISDCYSDAILVSAPLSVTTCSGATNTDAPVGEFIDSGGPNSDYSNDESCSIVITGGTKVFTFDFLDTEPGYDFVTIYKDAVGDRSKLLIEASGNSGQNPVTSNSTTNVLGFNSDGSVTGPGYKVTWTTPSVTNSQSIKIAADAASSSTRNVNLDLQFVPQFTQMYVTNTAACALGGIWENSMSTKPWVLSSGNGQKEVFVKFRDPAGVESACESDSIIMYDGPPAMAVLSGVPPNNDGENVLNVSVSGTDLATYKYKVGPSTSTVCTDIAGYSADISISTIIDENISRFGSLSLTLCVLGVNPIGVSQNINTPTTHTWYRDVPFMIQFESSGETIAEGATSVTFRVVSNSVPTSPITVYYDVYGDFVTSEGYTSSFVILPIGQAYADIVLPITANPVQNTDRRISVGISDITIPHSLGLITTSSVQVIDAQRPSMTVNDIGYYSSCAVLSNGKLVCRDSVGGNRESTYRFVEGFQEHVAGTSFKSIVVDQDFKCALSALNELYCWGWGFDGQLGIGNNNDQLYPQKVTGFTWKQVVASNNWNVVCGIGLNDDLYCWGDGTYSYGANGSGTTNDFNTPNLIDGEYKYKSVVMDGYSVCAIRLVSHQLVCWGLNDNYRLGDGTNTTRLAPVEIDSGVGYSSVYFQQSYTQGITMNGDWKIWGTRIDDSGSFNSTPQIIDSSRDYTLLTGTESLACGLSNGDMYCLGLDPNNLMGFGAVILSPTLIDSVDKYTTLKSGRNFICGITTASKLKCFGLGLAMTDSSSAWNLVPRLPTIWDADTFTKLVSVYSGMCAVTTAGLPKCVFSNTVNSTLDTRETWTPKLADSTMNIRSASNRRLVDENNKMYIWGSDVGATSGARSNPFRTERNTSVKSFYEYSPSSDNYCFIDTLDRLFCGGSYPGTGSASIGSPSIVSSVETYKSVSIGYEFSCGITTANDLKCWGVNDKYQLGLGDTTTRLTPVLVGSNFKTVGVGYSHACALKLTGELYCWGEHSVGLGNGSSTATIPTQIDAGTTFLDLIVGQTNCVIRSDNSRVMCWGLGLAIGNGSASDRTALTLTADTSAYTKLYVGKSNFTAVCGKTGSDLKCWGDYKFPRAYSPVTVYTGAFKDLFLGTTNILVGTTGKASVFSYLKYAPFGQQSYPKFEVLQGLVDRTPPVSP